MKLKGWKFKIDASKVPTFNCWKCKDTGWYYDYPQKDGWELCPCGAEQAKRNQAEDEHRAIISYAIHGAV